VTATTLDLTGRTDAERGFSLVETMVALCLLLVVTAGVLPLAVLTFRISENHGHLLARATEYSQDKLEQLMALAYGDVVTDTRVFPAVTVGGTGLTPGGSVNTAAPVDGYVDYLTLEGGLLATVVGGGAPADWYYQRVWQVEELGAADAARCPVQASAAQKCLKRITVTTIVRTAAQGGSGITPRSTVTALKTYPF
jgi:Prokaryotic N-terminal methylation motif